jgi:MFS family permease
MTLLNTLLAGLLTVGLPTIARDLHMADNLLLWPASVYALSCGCTLLLSGSISDVIGAQRIYLTGCFLSIAFTLSCGLVRTGIQLIMCRAFSGLSISLCLPSAVSIITSTFPTGPRRNISFACLGAAQPVGFSIGLVMGGVFVETIGWRYGYYIGAIANVVIFVVTYLGLPKAESTRKINVTMWQRLGSEIDWVGTILLSTPLGLLSYVFSVITSSSSRLRDPANTTVLCVSAVLLVAFVVWVDRQEHLERIAIIPNSLWKNRIFTSICIIVFFEWAIFNAFQFFLTLFFQEVQGLSAIQTSIRFLPMVVSGCLTNIATGLIVNHVPANVLILSTAVITSISPLLMANVKPSWSYWYGAFIADLLSPICPDRKSLMSTAILKKNIFECS